jgi:hypothetical protein
MHWLGCLIETKQVVGSNLIIYFVMHVIATVVVIDIAKY